MKAYLHLFQDIVRSVRGLKRSSLLSRRLTVGCFLVLGTACSKDQVTPDRKGGEPALQNEYALERIDYFIDENDRIDTVAVRLSGMEFVNWGNVLLEQKYMESFDELTKTSLFVMDTVGKGLPLDLDLAQFEVQVPNDYHGKEHVSLFKQPFFFSDSMQQKQNTEWATVEQKIKVAPYSKVIVERTIDRYDMNASFTALISNKTTGIYYTVSGIWEGTLRYNNHSIVFSENSLK